ncbi:hypothetical protein D3C80_1731770 [compost metagenome]
MGLLTDAPQVPAKPVLARLATVERIDGAQPGCLGQVQAHHLLTRLLDMLLGYPAIALGQTPEHHEQQLVIA